MNKHLINIDLFNYNDTTFKEGEINYVIFLNCIKEKGEINPYIGTIHVNLLSTLFCKIQEINDKKRNINGRIKLTFDNRSINFDVAIIGLIVLFKNNFPNVDFEFDIPLNDEPFFRFRNVLNCINNWQELINGVELFSVTKNGKLIKDFGDEPERVFPVFIVNSENFTKYFVNSENEWSLNMLLKEIQHDELEITIRNLYQKHYSLKTTYREKNYNIIRDLIRYYESQLSWQKNDRIIIRFYMSMLSYFDLATEQLETLISKDEIPFKHSRITGLSIEEMRVLKNELSSILQELNEQPIYFNLLFSLLAVRHLERKIKNLDEYKKNILNLFEYTKNLFRGIKELARNIIEHTETKTGIITGRILDATSLLGLKGLEKTSNLNDYLFEGLKYKENKKELENDDFFDIVIFDEGKKGIIAKTFEYIKAGSEIEEGSEKNLYLKDIELFRNNEINLKDFYNLQEFKLNQQAIKAASHWGLIIFTNLIIKNSGYFKVYTHNHQNINIIDYCIKYFNKSIISKSDTTTFSTGTYYDIILPLDKGISLKEQTIGNIIPKSPDFSVQNHVELLKYRIIKSVDEIKNDGEHCLFQVEVKDHLFSSNISHPRNIENAVANSITKLLTTEKRKKEISVLNNQFNYEDQKFKFIPVLDFSGCEDVFDQSKLFRLLGGMQKLYDYTSLIFINIKTDEIINLCDTLKSVSTVSNKSLWNANHFVLIYSYHKNETSDNKRIYYADILGGDNYNDWILLRNKLHSTHLTYYKTPFEIKYHQLTDVTKKGLKTSNIFIGENSAIKSFEMILNYNHKALYEYAIEFILDQTVGMDNIDSKYDKTENGYRIVDTHFKLGSKIHIKDFIYAKRLFQVSYYTNKFAYQVANYILDRLDNNLFELKGNRSISLIGYAEYSQMLLNRIKRILESDTIRNKYNIKNINHNILSDVAEPKFVKGESFNDNIIIIVPISTTFSTSRKIEVEIINSVRNIIEKENPELNMDEIIKKLNNKYFILQPYINIILVSHNDLTYREYVDELNTYLKEVEDNDSTKRLKFPYKQFNWDEISISNKEVKIKPNPDLISNKESPRIQKYFISVKSEWYIPDTCKFCFPIPIESKNVLSDISIINERALLETDKSSVTPNLLLELPETFKRENNNDATIWINKEAHSCGHFLYKGNHYLHFVDPLKFFERYFREIQEWAIKCRTKLQTIYPFIFQSSVLLISPSERDNTYFIEFINRYIFDDSANIIHYEVEGDFVENYQTFFKRIITRSDFIFYVDDFIKSGNTFKLVNDFVKYCLRESDEYGKLLHHKNRSCDGALSMISKADTRCKNDIISLLNQTSLKEIETNQKANIIQHDNDISAAESYLFFYELNVHNINKENCPLCLEQKRYRKLADNSILDTVKHYFLNKVVKLSEKQIELNIERDSGWGKYHPLVKDSADIILPWYEGSSEEVKELYETYENKQIIFPDKKYLKLLVEHELNYLLSNDQEIRENLVENISDLNIDNGINYDKNTQLRNKIVKKLISRPPFCNWIAIYNPATKIIFTEIFDDMVLKIFTLQPFVNVKPLREKAFSWVIIELHKCLDSLVSANNISFKDFRKFKFLLRRATLLGSNFTIRSQTLKKIQNIYQKYDIIEKENIENERLMKYNLLVNELKKLESTQGMHTDLFTNNECKIKFVKQAIQNLKYKDDSLNEFNYFYVSLIKEVTLGNEAKVIRLEKNVTDILKTLDYEKEKDYYFLLRLIQYENSILIKQGLELIVDKYLLNSSEISFDNKFRLGETRKQISQGFKSAINDTRLSSFKKFVGFSDFEKWENDDGTKETYYCFLHLLYLLHILKKDENTEKNTTTLENKTKAILQNLFRIVCDPNFSKHKINDNNIEYKDNIDSGAFITLKFRKESESYTKPEFLFIAAATKVENNSENKRILEIEVDEESMIYFMINGLTIITDLGKIVSVENKNSAYTNKPWTILELRKNSNNNNWQSIRGNVIPINDELRQGFAALKIDSNIKGSFTENIFNDGNYNNYGILRLAKLKIKNNEVINEGNVVISFFSNKVEGFDVKRLRLMLILKDYLQHFFELHYESDSITAFINERIKLKEYEKLNHSFKKYLGNLALVANDDKGINDKALLVDILHDLTKIGPILFSLISSVEDIFNKVPRDSDYLDQLTQISDLEITTNSHDKIIEFIKTLSKVIIENYVEDSSPIEFNDNIVQITNTINDIKVISYSKSFLRTIISQIIVNAKLYHASPLKIKIDFNEDENQNNLYWLSFSNRSQSSFVEKKMMRLKKNNIKFSSRGLSLIKRLSFVTTGYYPKLSFNQESRIFEISIPIRSL